MSGGSHGLITLARTRAPWAALRGLRRSAMTTEESGFLSVSLAQLSEGLRAGPSGTWEVTKLGDGSVTVRHGTSTATFGSSDVRRSISSPSQFQAAVERVRLLMGNVPDVPWEDLSLHLGHLLRTDAGQDPGDLVGSWQSSVILAHASRAMGAGQSSPLALRNNYLIAALPIGASSGTRGQLAAAVGGLDVVMASYNEARAAWLESLSRYRAWPQLAAKGSRWVEDETSRIFDLERVSGDAGLSYSDSDLLENVQSRIALPRFNLRLTFRLALLGGMSRGTLLLPIAAWIAGAGWAILAQPSSARWVANEPAWAIAAGAGAGYVVAGFLAVLRGPLASAFWCLRLPASAAIGVGAIVSLGLGDTWRPPIGVSGLLAAVALGYLCVEVKNNDVGGAWSVLRRAGTVWALGLLHAICIGAVGLALIAPALRDSSQPVQSSGAPVSRPQTTAPPDTTLASASGTQVWEEASAAGASESTGETNAHSTWLLQLLFLAAGGLAFGVLAQVLWEDRPVTAPLGRTDWH
jgi:hypothetical protein